VALKMGIKERERRVEVFFYGLFMDEELLRGKGRRHVGARAAFTHRSLDRDAFHDKHAAL